MRRASIPDDPVNMAPSRLPLPFAIAVGLSAIVNALPAPDPVAEPHPEITPFRVLQIPTRTLERRNILSDLEGDVNSVLSGLGSDIPSYVASGKSFKLPNGAAGLMGIHRHTELLPRLSKWRRGPEFARH